MKDQQKYESPVDPPIPPSPAGQAVVSPSPAWEQKWPTLPARGRLVKPSPRGLAQGVFLRRGNEAWRAEVVGYSLDGMSVWVMPVGGKTRLGVYHEFVEVVGDE